jgi:hypothetical protein
MFNTGACGFNNVHSCYFRRRLMEYDSHLLSLSAQAERQHAMISQWESQKNKLYKNNSTARWQNHRPNTDPGFEVDRG